ncbi:leukotriene B4 receptor 1-like [Polypterus senegalus]|uniref:leukotriene B4 receptor 1-like n=1 Tax=Polypterus senegalus TaxID=55291 RepID=UPI001966AC15|nr:leukotriene B4 receptor 1-like [Polypterus senegalus]XP_039601626.1 leukotriene B4 receptor 1-like [Polypterus senegalus]
MNNSCSLNFTDTQRSIGISFLAFAFLLGFPGNLFVVWTVVFQLRKRSVTSILVLNLAAADAVVLLTAPFFIHFLAVCTWEFGDAWCKTLHYMCCVNMYASVYLIAFMSLDRLMGIAKPFLSQKVRTKSKVSKVIFPLWVAAFLFSLPMVFYRKVFNVNGAFTCKPSHSHYKDEIFQYLFETLLCFVIPFSIMVGSYIHISRKLKNGRFQIRSRKRVNRLIVLIVISFAMFWMPYNMINIVQVTGHLVDKPLSDTLLTASKKLRPVVTAFAFISSSINPILYTFAGSAFIRTSGMKFIARLLEGNTEVNSVKKSAKPNEDKNKKATNGGSVILHQIQVSEMKNVTTESAEKK